MNSVNPPIDFKVNVSRIPIRLGAMLLSVAFTALAVAPSAVIAQQPADTAPPLAAPTGEPDMMLTVFMRHDQSKNLQTINETIHRQGFFHQFPPEGVEIVSWYIMMGIGQVVTIKFPPERLREINLIFENTLWGGYRTEFYPTYDFSTIFPMQREMMIDRPQS